MDGKRNIVHPIQMLATNQTPLLDLAVYIAGLLDEFPAIDSTASVDLYHPIHS